MNTIVNVRNPFDILFRDLFNTDGTFQPTTFENKQPHPLDIYFDDNGLHFEIACTGLSKKDIELEIDGDILKISYKKPEDPDFDYSGYIYKGLSKKSFKLGYKISAKYELEKLEAKMESGLLQIFVPIAESKKPKSIKIN